MVRVTRFVTTNVFSLHAVTRSIGAAAGRTRRSIDELPRGAVRVRVYAGSTPVSKRRHDLIEIVSPGPGAEKQARRVRDRLISQVEERRNPRTKATVDQLLERYLDQFDGAASTLTHHRGYVRKPHLVIPRQDQGRCAGRGYSGCVLRGAAPMPEPLLRAPVHPGTAPPLSMIVTTAALRTAAGR